MESRVLTNPHDHEFRNGFRHFLHRLGLGEIRLEGRNYNGHCSGLLGMPSPGAPIQTGRLVLVNVVSEVFCPGHLNVESSIFDSP